MRNASVTGRRALDDLEQAVVLDDDERVDVLAQRLDAVLGLYGAEPSLERERPRDDADGERSELAPDLGDDGRAARARCRRPRRR